MLKSGPVFQGLLRHSPENLLLRPPEPFPTTPPVPLSTQERERIKEKTGGMQAQSLAWGFDLYLCRFIGMGVKEELP